MTGRGTPGAPEPAGHAPNSTGRGDSSQKKHTAPITPLVHAATALPIAIIAGWVISDQIAFLPGSRPVRATVLAAFIVAAVSARAYVAWMRTEYYFDADGDFRLDTGIISRQERRLQLSRLQSVDVVQPLAARLFGMAQVAIDVAGTGDSRAEVKYLAIDEATALRNEILARSAGVAHDAGEAPEAVLVTVPTTDLVTSLLLRGTTAMLALLTILIVASAFFAAGPGALVAVLISGGVPLLAVLTEFTRYFNFTVAEAGDGVRLRFGLLQTQSLTVPPGRVAAVDFVQPLLWRSRDWVRVRLTVAGMKGSSDDGSSDDRILLPVAPREVALEIVRRILPGVDVDAVPLTGVPQSVRRRAPIQWRQLGVGSDAAVFVSRRGRVVRHLTVSPHARTQSVRVTQGPWQRWVHVASVHLDIVPGPVRVVALHRPVREAYALAAEQVRYAHAARSADRSIRWASRDFAARASDADAALSGETGSAVQANDEHPPRDAAGPASAEPGRQPGPGVTGQPSGG